MHEAPLTGPVVLVPVKAFGSAKARLAPVLDASERAALARAMATHVVTVAAPLPVAVVCDDADVEEWARSLLATVIRDSGDGLNAAVGQGVAELTAAGATEVLVVHADLPDAHRLGRLAGFGGITLVPDRRLDGTNVVCLPAGIAFEFRYGSGSFARHEAQARRLGVPVRILHDPALAWDVDTPADLPSEGRRGLTAPFEP